MKKQGLNKYVKHGQGGFTLIELLIVVAIIGILAAIAIPRYQDYVVRSQVSAAVATIRGVLTQAEDYALRGVEITTDSASDGYVGVTASQSYGTVAATGSSDAVITYIFNDDAAEGIRDDGIAFTRSASGWSCTASAGASTIDPKFLPEVCK